jgi:thiamine biosynthesis lipoprotein
MNSLLLASLVATAPPGATVLDREISAMGTRLTIHVQASERGAALEATERAIRAVEAAEDRLSTWRKESELSQVNGSKPGTPVSLSPKLARDLSMVFACAKSTSGSFDPAIGPLVAAWGLRTSGRIPSARELTVATVDSDPGLFELGPGTITKRKDGAAIEEGAWGKGVGLDDAADELRSAKVSEAELNFGGQVLLMGTGESEVAIADPEQRDRVLLTLLASDGSVSTSGNSEHGLNVGGRKVGHILDPRTGKPAPFSGSVTVIAPTGAEADCLSTGLFVMGPKKGLAWLKAAGTSPKLQAIFIDRQSKTRGWIARASCGLKGKLRPADPHVKLVFDCNPNSRGESR